MSVRYSRACGPTLALALTLTMTVTVTLNLKHNAFATVTWKMTIAAVNQVVIVHKAAATYITAPRAMTCPQMSGQ